MADHFGDDQAIIRQSRRLFLRNLAFGTSAKELEHFFAKHGEIKDVSDPNAY